MAYENIRLRKSNFTMVDGYFYTIDEELDSMVVKTDDGTQAYSYPLDTVITSAIITLEYDGRNFWSLENPSTNNMRIRRWYIDNYVCKLRNTFDLVANASHSYSSNAFTVEHYHETFTANEDIGQSTLSISNGLKLTSGMIVTLGPNDDGQVEEFTVNSAGADFVNINGTTTHAYEIGDPVAFYKNIWMFNNFDGKDSANGALYKIDAYTGSYISKVAGGAYKDIRCCTFYDMSGVYGTNADAIAYVKTTNMIFLNPNDITNSYGSMVLDNIESNLATVIVIYDLTIEGTNVYRLQRKATYYGATTTFADSTYNYQLSTTDSFITSISLRADPAILPANGVNTSTITAIVKDQFNLPVVAKLVSFTDDDTVGVILTTPVVTDANGVASTQYRSGTSAREVRIVATAQQS
jgi:hypothetical protein